MCLHLSYPLWTINCQALQRGFKAIRGLIEAAVNIRRPMSLHSGVPGSVVKYLDYFVPAFYVYFSHA